MKGISPLIAAVLLIAFTVAIATLIAGWFSTFTRTTTASVTNKTNLAVGCSNAAISIQDVWVKSGLSATVRALVANTGFNNNMNITSALVYNSTGQAVAADSLPASSLAPGSSVILQFSSVNMSSCPAYFDRVVVGTDCVGISDTFTGTPHCE